MVSAKLVDPAAKPPPLPPSEPKESELPGSGPEAAITMKDIEANGLIAVSSTTTDGRMVVDLPPEVASLPRIQMPFYYDGKRRMLMMLNALVFSFICVTFIWVLVVTNGGDETYYAGRPEYEQMFKALKKFRPSVLTALLMGALFQLTGFFGARYESFTWMTVYLTLCVSTMLGSYLRLGFSGGYEEPSLDPEQAYLESPENEDLGMMLIATETLIASWLIWDMYFIRKQCAALRPAPAPIVLIY